MKTYLFKFFNEFPMFFDAMKYFIPKEKGFGC